MLLGLGFGVEGLGLRALGSGFRVEGLGFFKGLWLVLRASGHERRHLLNGRCDFEAFGL